MTSCSINFALSWTNRVFALTHYLWSGLLATWLRRSWSLLVQVMASCLTTAAAYLQDICMHFGCRLTGMGILIIKIKTVSSIFIMWNLYLENGLYIGMGKNGITVVTLRGHVKSIWESKTYMDNRGPGRRKQVSMAWMCNYIYCGV